MIWPSPADAITFANKSLWSGKKANSDKWAEENAKERVAPALPDAVNDRNSAPVSPNRKVLADDLLSFRCKGLGKER